MTQNENAVNTLPKGIYIPHHIAMGLFQMRAVDAGRVVCNMIRLSDGKALASRDLDAMAPEGRVAFVIWSEFFEQHRRRNG